MHEDIGINWEEVEGRLRMKDQQEALRRPTIAPRTGHPGQMPDPANDPNYVPPDQLPPGNVSPEYNQLADFLYGGEWLYVTSSNVKAIQYDDKEQLLTVEFLNGSVYQYPNVPEVEAMDFATAPSKGRWVWQHLRPRSDYVLLTVGGPIGGKLPRYAQGKNRFRMKKVKGGRRTYNPGAGTRQF